ncbi:hypothetical protein [Catellatospora sp. NPDC049609]|uniref:COG4315 family predicted lipoprotein n=1 Tax=Catellatospora sp. NPDC049609 TaxID=3155505 RepID=UPI003434AD35
MSFLRRKRWVLAAVACVGLLGLGGVVLSSGEGPAKAKPETLVPLAQQSPVAPPAGMVALINTPKGKAVADHQGYVLYTSKKDRVSKDGKAVSSSCDATCAKTWPPALAESGMPIALPGIDPRALGVLVRPDGGKQITLNGHPLYRYINDARPGQPSGDGVEGIWQIARP